MAMGAVALIIVRIEVSGSKWDVEVSDLDELTKLAKLIYAYLLLLTASFAATRFAILALYLRIFQNTKLRRVIWMAIVFVALQNTAVMLVSVFSCWPVSNFWTPTTWPHAVCINRDAFYRSMTPINIAVDAALVVLPLPTVWHLKATRFRKWALTFVFGLGSLALIISAVRLVMILTNKNGVMPSPSNTNSLFIWIYSKCKPPIEPFTFTSILSTNTKSSSRTIGIPRGSMSPNDAPHCGRSHTKNDHQVGTKKNVMAVSLGQERTIKGLSEQ